MMLSISLWWTFNVSTMLKYCYNKCVKRFFSYNKYDSATAVFVELKLPTANTVLHIIDLRLKLVKRIIVTQRLIRDVYRPTTRMYTGLHHCLNVCECVSVPVCCFMFFNVSMDPRGLIQIK